MSSFERLENAPGLTPTEICMELYAYAKQVPGDEAIVELGVFKGRSACYLAHGARHGNGPHVYGIDPWNLAGNIRTRHKFHSPTNYRAAQLTIRKQGMGRYVTLVRGFSTDVASRWDGPKVGLLHVDGDHSYGAVRGDLLAWATHLAPGAVIAFDDYAGSHNPDVAKAVDALVAEGVLAPITLLHNRLAVTSLTSTAPMETWEEVPVVDETITEDAPVEGTAAEEVVTVEEEAVPEPVAAPPETSEDQEVGTVDSEPTSTENSTENSEEKPTPPPRAGAGSSRDAWINYAVQVTDRPEGDWATMTRPEIIAKLEDLGRDT